MKRRTPRRPQLTQGELDWLTDGEHPDATLRSPCSRRAQDLWDAHGAWAVAEVAHQFPGTRSWPWWRYASPEPRLRLGGIGDSLFCRDEQYRQLRGNWCYGLPNLWFDERTAKVFNGKSPFGPRPKPGRHFVAVEWLNPPRFESEPAYLQRLGLLLPGELERIPAKDFEPEPIQPPPSDPTPSPPRAGRPAFVEG